MEYYQFAAVRGIQAKKEYYICMLPYKYLFEMFKSIILPINPPYLRSQRILNKSRLPAIKNYILNNSESYVFSAIVISVDGEIEFKNTKDNFQLGYLRLAKNSKFVVNDGQHRIEAIKQAFKEKPELKYETISAIFYYDAGLKNSQQIFTDLNRYTVKPTPSISILYDSRDTLADLTRYLADNVYYFKDLTEYEKTSISNRSIYMFTLNGIYNSTKELLSKKSKFDILDENEKELAKEYWTILGDNIYEWSLIKNGKTTSKYLRDNFIHSHNLFLYVMGRIGNYLIQNRMNFKNYLEKLSNINWSRKNQEWEGIALNNGRLSKSKINIDNTYNFIMNKLEITKCFKSEVVDNVFN